jgi:hypothetical protein
MSASIATRTSTARRRASERAGISEHATVARWGTTRMALAFFTLNGVISCVLGILGIVDILI